jgi:predicted methyltransferase
MRWLAKLRAQRGDAIQANFDQCPATLATVRRRLKLLTQNSRDILLLGDDDLLGLAVAATRARSRIVILDADKNLLRSIEQYAPDAVIELVKQDLRKGLPRSLHDRFDDVFTDPPYTLAGQLLFVQRGMLALRAAPEVRLFLCASRLYLTQDQFNIVRLFLARGGFRLEVSYRKFNRYRAPSDVSRDLKQKGRRNTAWLESDLLRYVRERSAPVPRLPPGTLARIYSYDDPAPA